MSLFGNKKNKAESFWQTAKAQFIKQNGLSEDATDEEVHAAMLAEETPEAESEAEETPAEEAKEEADNSQDVTALEKRVSALEAKFQRFANQPSRKATSGKIEVDGSTTRKTKYDSSAKPKFN